MTIRNRNRKAYQRQRRAERRFRSAMRMAWISG